MIFALPPSETTRLCPHCSASLDAGASAQLCPSCGRSLASPQARSLWVRSGRAAVVTIVLTATGMVCLLVAASFGYDIRTIPHRIFRIGKGKPPVYQWIQAEDKTFSFLAGEGKAWGPIEPQGGEIRYVISAALPVDTGLMERAAWEERMDAWNSMKTSSTCYESKIMSSSKVCRVSSDKPYLIFIRDLRAKQFGLGGLTPELVNPRALEEQNSVTITTFTRKCMENCE